MKARPIIFSGAMVRALPEGRKTQTRRVLKSQPVSIDGIEPHPEFGDEWIPWRGGEPLASIVCPYGQPGDLLWVRETFIGGKAVGGFAPGVDPDIDPLGPTVDVIYRADDGPNERTAGPWTSPIHMPRHASRLTLELTDVRVERIAEITEEDAQAEGAPTAYFEEAFEIPSEFLNTPARSFPTYAHHYGFQLLWESIHGPGAWQRNDWVCALNFRTIQANVNDVLADPAAYGVEVAA